jgi:hypothetical protein
VRREQIIHRLQEQSQQLSASMLDMDAEESLSSVVPTDHYHISLDLRHKIQLHQWLKENKSDPALQVISLLSNIE